jgi:hypothetical protein
MDVLPDPPAALSVSLRLQLKYAALPPHAALHFLCYSDILPGLPFVLCPIFHRLHHIDLVPVVLPLSRVALS